MSEKNYTITTGNSFNSLSPEIILTDVDVLLQRYGQQLVAVLNLDNDIPIFLDTNVLLRGYSISPERRDMLYDFFESRKKQIIISKQVQEEFDRNRKDIIDTYAQQPEAQLTDLDDPFARLLLELKNEDTAEEEEANPEDPTDELMDIYEQFEKIDNLSKEERKFLAKEFDELKKEFKKQQQLNIKSNNAFPGQGDIIEKPAFPYGDYFLFHEMLKYAGTQKKDVLFLTFDVAKNDWLQKNKTPHPHYIQKSFALTQQLIFIIDAHSFFEKLFDTDFEAIVPKEQPASSTNYTVSENDMERNLRLAFVSLEKTLERKAHKLNIKTSHDFSVRELLDELNYENELSDADYYELKGIWPVREALADGNLSEIRRRYTVEELAEVLAVTNALLRKFRK